MGIKMKILIMDIIKPLASDGSMIHRWELARNLAKLDCDVYAMSYTRLTHKGLYVLSPISKKRRFGYIAQLLKLVTKNKFDILYTRNVIKGIIGVLIKKLWKSKLVFEVNAISHDEQRLLQNQVSTKENLLGNSKMKIFKYLENFVCKNSDAIITVTQGIKDYLVNCGIDNNKINVIENGANTELFQPINNCNALKKRLHINNDESILIFVGNLAPWQGVEYLVCATPLIIKENRKIKILIVGDGILKKKLVFLSKELNLEPYIIFTGTVPHEKVPQYINISDLCVAPFLRIRNESMGLSPLKIYEYLACGKPVVASNIKGVGNLLKDSNSGIAVIPEDSAKLANSIIKLLKDKKLREKMGDNGRKFVLENYSWEISAKKTLKVFRKINNVGFLQS